MKLVPEELHTLDTTILVPEELYALHTSNDINSWRTNNLFASGKYFAWINWGEIIGIHVWVSLDEISLL